MHKIIIITLALMLSFFFSAAADTIVLKSGKIIEARILEKTDEYVKVDISGVVITYYTDEIESIGGNKTSPASLTETANNINETSPLSQKKEEILKETVTSDKIKDATSREEWISSKPVADYLKQLQQITLDVQQKSVSILQKLKDRSNSKPDEILSELKALGSEITKKMQALVPPRELSTFHKLQIESLDYGQLVCTAGLDKDINKADSYYLKGAEADKKANEEFKRVCNAYGCPADIIQQLDRRIEEEEREIKRVQGLHPDGSLQN